MHILSRPVPMIGTDVEAMHRVCKRIAARRDAERNTLPALEADHDELPRRPADAVPLYLVGLALLVHAGAVALGLYLAR